MISLRLIPMRIRADIIRLRSLYHVLMLIISCAYANDKPVADTFFFGGDIFLC